MTSLRMLLSSLLICCWLGSAGAYASEAGSVPAIDRILNEADANNTSALEHLEAMYAHQGNATPPQLRMQTMLALIGLYYDAGENKRSDAMLADLSRLARQTNNAEFIAQAEILKAIRLVDGGHADQALSQLLLVQKKLPANPSAELNMRLNSALGRAYFLTGNFDGSLHCYLEALRLTEFLSSRQVQQRILKLDAVAQLYVTMKDPEKALATIAEAMKLSPQTNFPKAYASLSINEGMAYSDLKQPKQAFEAYLRALKTARAAGAQMLELVSLIDLTDYYLTVKDYKNAEQYARIAMRRAKQADDNQSYMVAKVNLGFAIAGQGRINAGMEYVNDMVKYLLDADRKTDAETVLRDQADVYEQAGMYREALNTLRQQQRLSNELFRSDRSKAVAALQEQFDAGQRQKQIELLARENQLKDAEIRNHNLQLLVVLLGGIATILGGLFLLSLYRRVKRINQQLMEANSQLEFHAVRDPLTGLFNRRSFVELMRGRNEQPQPERREPDHSFPDSLILLDIDHFKQVNDLYGHATGDAVLLEVAKRLRNVVRESDTVLRWGGEEFLIFAPKSDPEQIEFLVGRLLNAVGESAIETDGHSLQVTMTAGFIALPYSTIPETDFDWEKALQIADMALYLGKANGRNRGYGVSALKVPPAEGLPVLEQDLTAAIAAGMVDLVEVHGPQKLDTVMLRYADSTEEHH